MRRLTRLSEILAQFLMLTLLSSITVWSIYTAFEALRESPWWLVAVTFFILLGFAVLIYQGLELIARITDPPYPNAHRIDDLEVRFTGSISWVYGDFWRHQRGNAGGNVPTGAAEEEQEIIHFDLG